MEKIGKFTSITQHEKTYVGYFKNIDGSFKQPLDKYDLDFLDSIQTTIEDLELIDQLIDNFENN